MPKKKATAREITHEIQARVTARIIEQLEQGVVPWAKPWDAGPMRLPYNPFSHHVYSGSNVILLWMAMMSPFRTPRFLTYKQAQDAGGQVRKGEQGFGITKYGLAKAKEGAGEKAGGGDKDKSIPFLRAYTVFNVDQVDGLPPEFYAVPEPKHKHQAVAEIDEFVRATGADIRDGGTQAYYNVTQDFIGMPDPGYFDPEDEGAYYAVLLHELTHWTGAKGRLDRLDDKNEMRSSYAFEELVAELGAAFIAAEFGIDRVPKHATYLDSWLSGMREHPKMIFEAGKLASKARDFLHEIGEPLELPKAA